ncbi:MAG: hypothetical protein Tsb0020_51600 [Haliangiales bacterium]
MRMLLPLSVLAGALALSACVDDTPPVDPNKQLRNLDGHEIWEVCHWAREYAGGDTAAFSCPDDDLTDNDFGDAIYIPPTVGECGQTLAGFQDTDCVLNVGDYRRLVEDSSTDPCTPQTVEDSAGCSITRAYSQSGGNN